MFLNKFKYQSIDIDYVCASASMLIAIWHTGHSETSLGAITQYLVERPFIRLIQLDYK